MSFLSNILSFNCDEDIRNYKKYFLNIIKNIIFSINILIILIF